MNCLLLEPVVILNLFLLLLYVVHRLLKLFNLLIDLLIILNLHPCAWKKVIKAIEG